VTLVTWQGIIITSFSPQLHTPRFSIDVESGFRQYIVKHRHPSLNSLSAWTFRETTPRGPRMGMELLRCLSEKGVILPDRLHDWCETQALELNPGAWQSPVAYIEGEERTKNVLKKPRHSRSYERETTRPASQPTGQPFFASFLCQSSRDSRHRSSAILAAALASLDSFSVSADNCARGFTQSAASSLWWDSQNTFGFAVTTATSTSTSTTTTTTHPKRSTAAQQHRSKVWLYSCAAPLSLSWSLAAGVPDVVSRLRRYIAWHNPCLAWGSFVKAPSPPTPTLLSSFSSNRPAAANERTNKQNNQINKQVAIEFDDRHLAQYQSRHTTRAAEEISTAQIPPIPNESLGGQRSSRWV
jgi:hypothetical protein